MKKNLFTISNFYPKFERSRLIKSIKLLFFLLPLTLINCKKENPIIVETEKPLPSNILLRVIENEDGTLLTWDKINSKLFSKYTIFRSDDESQNVLISPENGEMYLTQNNANDTFLLDKDPAITDNIFYKVIASTTDGKEIHSNFVKIKFKNSIFIPEIKLAGVSYQTSNNTFYLTDGFQESIAKVDLNNNSYIKSLVLNGSVRLDDIIAIDDKGINDMYASYSNTIYKISKATLLREGSSIGSTSRSFCYYNNCLYLPNYSGVKVYNIVTQKVIQTFNLGQGTVDAKLRHIPNTNKIIRISDQPSNEMVIFDIDNMGMIAGYEKVLEPRKSFQLSGLNYNLSTNGKKIITGINGNIYNMSLDSIGTLNLKYNPFLKNAVTFSPNDKYIATCGFSENKIIIYDAITYDKIKEIEINKTYIRHLFWENNDTIIAIGETLSISKGIVVVKKKIK